MSDIQIRQSTPNYMLEFHKDGKKVGAFDFSEGKMNFEGDLSESGKIFVDWVLEAFKQRLEEEREATKEKAAKVCEEYQDPFCGAAMAEAIRSMK